MTQTPLDARDLIYRLETVPDGDIALSRDVLAFLGHKGPGERTLDQCAIYMEVAILLWRKHRAKEEAAGRSTMEVGHPFSFVDGDSLHPNIFSGKGKTHALRVCAALVRAQTGIRD